jgi:tyrosyl-tRNA synthetase
MDDVDALVAAHQASPDQRLGQKTLAAEVTEVVHGPAALAAVHQAAAVLFGADPREASAEALAAVAREVPGATLAPGESLAEGVDLAAVLVRTGLASSGGDARRQIDQHGISVNGRKVEAGRPLTTDDLVQDRWVLLRKGKKGWAVLDAGA